MTRFSSLHFALLTIFGAGIGAVAAIAINVPFATAQIQPALDGTGTQTTNVGDAQIDITGGSLSSDRHNLFHSFEDFGLTQNQIANFLVDSDIQAILGRVVGGDASIIDGLIQVSGGDADLYLMNPAGILFGPSARLDVPGDFTATTANGIGFEGGWFDAVGENAYGELVGLPTQFAFTVPDQGGISGEVGSIINAGALSLLPGHHLMLLGGTVINTGTLEVPGGQITIAAVPNQNLVRISREDMVLNLELEALAADTAATLPSALPFNPLSLPSLLTDSGIGNATGVEVLGDGQIRLTGAGLTLPGKEGMAIATAPLSAASSSIAPESEPTLEGDNDPAAGGTISIVAGDSIIVTDRLDVGAYGEGDTGAGGQIQLTADNTIELRAGAIATASSRSSNGDAGDGGTIQLSAGNRITSNGSIDAMSSATAGNSGNGGVVELFAGNELEVLNGVNVSATSLEVGRSGRGGNMILESGGTLTIAGLLDASTTSNAGESLDGGEIRAIATTDLVLDGTWDTTANSSADSGSEGGELQLTSETGSLSLNLLTSDPDDNRQRGPVYLDSDVGTTLNLDHSGHTNPIFSTTGHPLQITSQGPISITSNTPLITLATEGSELTIAGSDLTLNNVNLSTRAVDETVGGELTLEATTGAIAVGNLDSQGSTAGAINVLAATAITTGTINARGATGDGGRVLLDPSGDIQVQSINTEGGLNGVGGTVDITTGRFFRATDTFTSQDGTPASISTHGGQGEGNIIIRHGGGATTPFTIGQTGLVNGTAGGVSTGNHELTLGESFLGSVTRGTIQLITDNPSPNLVADSTISPSDPNASSQPSTPTSVTPSADSPLAPTTDNSPTTSLTPLAASPTPSAPNQNPSSTPGLSQNRVAGQSRAPLSGQPPQQTHEFSRHPNPQSHGDEVRQPPREGVEDVLSMDDHHWERGEEHGDSHFEFGSMEDMEAQVMDDYAAHFGLPTLPPSLAANHAQEQLRQIQDATGVSPALIYARFIPVMTAERTAKGIESGAHRTDELELMLVTGHRNPIRVQLPGITRTRVERVIRQFQSDITSPAHRGGDRYLTSARTLYQWLVAPLEDALATEQIENLSFILDNGLRSLPMAALHDGEHFLIERYSVGIMPSLSLTDTRYVDTRDMGILAMGASEFAHLAPLPAVPIELATITEEVWGNGAYFLNQDFTLENLKAQRRQRPYGIVHLATHGEFRAGTPADSYIQLSDRQLHLGELRDLDLHDPAVELLVLSACRTALGDDNAELGFAGLALQTGVKSVLASLWYVSDTGALSLTTEFYRQLQTTPIKSEALRQAQLAMIRGEVTWQGDVLRNARGQTTPLPTALEGDTPPNLAHPFYWSAFTMIGSPW